MGNFIGILILVVWAAAVIFWLVKQKIRAKKTGQPICPGCPSCGKCSDCESN